MLCLQRCVEYTKNIPHGLVFITKNWSQVTCAAGETWWYKLAIIKTVDEEACFFQNILLSEKVVFKQNAWYETIF